MILISVLVENAVVVELKAVDKLLPLHEAQLLSYLKLSKRKLGLLINFHVAHLRMASNEWSTTSEVVSPPRTSASSAVQRSSINGIFRR
jgi:hypothetical protein